MSSEPIKQLGLLLEANGYEWYKPTDKGLIPETYGWKRTVVANDLPLYTIKHRLWDTGDTAYSPAWKSNFVHEVAIIFYKRGIVVTSEVSDNYDYEYYERLACEINKIIE